MFRILKLLLWAFILALIAVTAAWFLTSQRANTGQRDFRVLEYIKNPGGSPGLGGESRAALRRCPLPDAYPRLYRLSAR